MSIIKTNGSEQYRVVESGTSGISVDTIINSTGTTINSSFSGLKMRKIEDAISYLTFTPESGTVSVTPSSYWNATTKEYSTDNGSTWNTWDGSSAVVGSTVKFRGLSGTIASGMEDEYVFSWTVTGTNVSVSGNIETILDYQVVGAGNHPTMGIGCCTMMFNGASSIVNAENLVLPATTLVQGCYAGMFFGCLMLLTAPELPATTLADYCYVSMFQMCIKLTTPPTLPATTLADGCYSLMFSSCMALTSVPELPATTLAEECYYGMFSQGCIHLYASDTSGTGYDKAWTIPSSGTFSNTYSQEDMFEGCLGTRSSDSLAGESGQSYTYYTQNTPV